jgi:hypothetical protein
MPVRTDTASVVRESKSDLDRQAIGLAGRLLTTGVWLECQLKSTAKRGTAFVERPSWLGPAGRLLDSSASKINQPRNEES